MRSRRTLTGFTVALPFAILGCVSACSSDGDGAKGSGATAGTGGVLVTTGGTGGTGGTTGGTTPGSGGSAARGGSGSSGGTGGSAAGAGRGSAGVGGSASAGAGGKGGPAAGTGGRGSAGTGGTMTGEAGAPEPRGGNAGTSPYELECHGDTVMCGDPTALLCLGLRVDQDVLGYSCSRECQSDADCSTAPASTDAEAGCIDFVNKKYCLLVCKDGAEEASCPSGMYCYVYAGTTFGYCLWH